MWIFPWIKIGWLNWCWKFICGGYLPLIWKDYAEGGTSFCKELISRKLYGFLLVFDWLYFIQCLNFFSSIENLLHLYSTVFDAISSTTDEILSINPFANVFVFRDFTVHHKNWLTYSGGTDISGELCYHFSISNDLTQMVSFLTRILHCDCHSPALLDLFLCSNASICSTMTFPFIGKFWSCGCLSFHWLSVKLKARYPVSRHSLRLFSCWLGRWSSWPFERWMIHGRLSLNSVLLLLLVNFVIGFRLELMYISLIVNIRLSLTHIHGFQLLVLLQ